MHLRQPLAPKKKTLPDDVVEQWPDIYGEVSMYVLPLQYLHSISINFKDRKIWEIELNEYDRNKGWPKFEKSLSKIFTTYEEQIHDIDFKMNTLQIKLDVISATTAFFKKIKL